MTVSWRYITAGAASIAALAAANLSAGAQSSTGHQVQVPGATINAPGVNHGTPAVSSGCCGHTNNHRISVPNVGIGVPSVNVNPGTAGVQANIQANQNVNVVTGTSGDSGVIFQPNGTYIPGQPGVPPSFLDRLNVGGVTEQYTETVQEQVPVTVEREVCYDAMAQEVSVAPVFRPVQAVCIDDTGMPHPASQVDEGQRVKLGFEGELFRCMSGTSMQVTVGHMLTEQQASFEHAETFACQKGEALVHTPSGELTCAPQRPRRDCNERSLLRKYGPGIKLIQSRMVCTPQRETVIQTQTREVVKERPVVQGPIVFDGGVGQGVF